LLGGQQLSATGLALMLEHRCVLLERVDLLIDSRRLLGVCAPEADPYVKRLSGIVQMVEHAVV